MAGILVFALVLGGFSSVSRAAVRSTNASGYRAWDLELSASNKTGFTLLTSAQTGVSFTNALALERSLTNHVLLNGSGVAAGDIDGDGRVDLYFCGLDTANKLYRNLGNWQFEDITDQAGVAGANLDATGTTLVDVDGDEDLDLIVNSIAGGTHLFLNDGKARFSPSPRSPVLNSRQAGTSLALADMDGDGALDLYVANYRPMFFFLDKPETRYSVRMVDGQQKVTMIDGRPVTDPEFTNRFIFQVHVAQGKVTFSKEELGQVDAFYRNDGRGGFHPVSFTGGAFRDEDGQALAEPPRDWGLSVMFRDLNADGMPDLYVCNDFRTPDRIWLNEGRGRFRALPRLAMRQTCLSSMGLDVADINRDGSFDILVADMLSTEHSNRLAQRIDIRPEILAVGQIESRPQFSRNMLQLSRGDGTFMEIAQFAGLDASDWTWSPVFLDVDLDGYEDLLVANGFERDTMSVDMQRRTETLIHQQKLRGLDRLKIRKIYPRLDTPNLAFRNLGNRQFTNVSAAWGFNIPAISQGMCLADLDNDGDLDVIVNQMNREAGLYRNETAAPRVAVRLKGAAPNTRGIGAKIEVFGGPVYQSQEMICGGRYCSSDDPMRTFAAGALTNRLQLVVTWPGGRRSTVEDARGNRLYEIEEAQAGTTNAPLAGRSGSAVVAAFRDVTPLLHHTHHEEPFDDFDRQPLLPGKLSQSGPGLCWTDINQDGWDDLVIGTGRGGQLAVYRNDGKGAFQPIVNPRWAEPAARDQTAVLAWPGTSGARSFLVGSSSYEDGQTAFGSVRAFDLTVGAPEDLLPGVASSTGPMVLADIDSDGDLDLFVGGRVVPGRYPEPASSRLFRNENGELRLDSENTKELEQVGLVSGAVFSDLDLDGAPDLILACEWGPVRVFKNRDGQFREATQALGLGECKGWWNGVNTGDFNGDGRLDIVASNWGRNSRYEPVRQQPLRLVYGDFNGDSGIQTLEAYFEPRSGKVVPWRRLDDVAKAIPFVSGSFETFQAFGQASIEEILGDRFSKAKVLEATWLESTLFLNRGDRFDPVALPWEAQITPAFGVCVADFNGDGWEDIFLSQNFFAVQTEMSRYDAGRGLWLRGNGRGQFQAVSGAESGLLIYGEQRGAAVCDYDQDGRVDLVVSQNGAATRLFLNQTARPGLRVRLAGPRGNPEGIGAVLQLAFGSGKGPAREIHGGAGYLSQDSATQVFGIPTPPQQLQIRWPGGRATTTDVPAGAREILVGLNGKAQVIR